MEFPAGRDLRLQALARGDEGFLLALGYSTQRGYARTHPFVGEIRMGEVEVSTCPETRLRGARSAAGHADRMRDGQPVPGLGRGARRNSPAAMAWSSAIASARRWRCRWSTGRFGRGIRRGYRRPGPGCRIRDVSFRQCPGDRLCRASEAAALCRLPGRARSRPPHATPNRTTGAVRTIKSCRIARRQRNDACGIFDVGGGLIEVFRHHLYRSARGRGRDDGSSRDRLRCQNRRAGRRADGGSRAIFRSRGSRSCTARS